MDEKEQIRRRIAAGNFVANNGRVLRTINILRYDYKKLREIEYALPDMEHGQCQLPDRVRLHQAAACGVPAVCCIIGHQVGGDRSQADR